MTPHSAAPIRGRGASINPDSRFSELHVEADPEAQDGEERPGPKTRFYTDSSETILNRNDSPDIPFTYSLNPYRGCEHGCIYCYARPTHEYLGFSAGLDFESRIMVKTRAPELLRAALMKKSWQPQSVSLSGVTDCYQPAERHFKLTRRCLEVFLEFRNPVGIVTKSALITRDADILAELARHDCVAAFVSVTSLKADLAMKLEPRAALPEARLRTIRTLADAGVPVGVMAAPIIPGLNDEEIPAILKAAAEAGACTAGYVMLRLPYGVKELFSTWLDHHFPLKKPRILGLIESVRDGKLNDAAFGDRMRGTGNYADQIAQWFEVAAVKSGLDGSRRRPLSAAGFRRPPGPQLELF
jgi:DNA repair photolyase